jgi:hypothetical protein
MVQREAAAIATDAGRLWLPRPGVEAQDEARGRPGGIHAARASLKRDAIRQHREKTETVVFLEDG